MNFITCQEVFTYLGLTLLKWSLISNLVHKIYYEAGFY